MNSRRPKRRATKVVSSVRALKPLKRSSKSAWRQPTSMPPEPFPAPEPIRPVFCCPKIYQDPNYISTLGSMESLLQRNRVYNFVTNISAYSLSNGISVARITWSEDAEYLIQVLKWRKKDVLKTKRKRKDNWTKRKGKSREKKRRSEEKWVQAELGRSFVETRHEKGKRWPDHAFEEVLLTEEGIPREFSKVDEVRLEVGCVLHGEVRYVSEFWKKG